MKTATVLASIALASGATQIKLTNSGSVVAITYDGNTRCRTDHNTLFKPTL
jgi:hypothetical protein